MFIRNLASYLWYGNPKSAVEVLDANHLPLVTAKLETPPAADSAPNPLDEFNKKVAQDRVKIKALLASWEEDKKNVMGENAPELQGHVHTFECDLEKQNEVKSVFKLIIEKIKSYFQSVSSHLQAQLDHEVYAKGHIKDLEAHIAKLEEVACNAELSADERRDARIHICNASIVILSELDYLANDFLDDILSAVQREQSEESVVRAALTMATMMISSLIGMALPFVEFDCKERFKKTLDRSISSQKVSYDLAEGEVEAILAKAHRVVMDGSYAKALRKAGGSVSAPSEQKVENVSVEIVAEQPRPL
jgi:hypothetical protein